MNIIAALLIAVGLIIGGFLAGGRYHVIVPPKTETHDLLFLIEVDRFTGGVRVCLPSDKPWRLEDVIGKPLGLRG